MKILIIQQKMIGDVLTSTILFEVLKKRYGDSKLHYLINPNTYPVVEHNPHIDKFIFLRPETEKNYWKFLSFVREIKNSKYDVVIDVYGKLSSNLVTLFSGAKLKIGYHKKHTSFLYTNPIKRLKSPSKNYSLAIENRLRLLNPLKIATENISPKIYLQQEEKDAMVKVLKSFSVDLSKPMFMISVLGSNSKKTYPPKYMAQLLDRIVSFKPEAQLFFNYIPSQLTESKEIYELCHEHTRKRVFFDVYGNSLYEFLALTSFCTAMIGNEGGAVNMAKAIQVPTFMIFNPALNKSNWFGETEIEHHVAVHLSDYITYQKEDYKKAGQNPEEYYNKFKPTFIEPKLIDFLNQI